MARNTTVQMSSLASQSASGLGPTKRPPLARHAGFTLIEVLVALTLLAITAGSLLAAQAGAGRLTRQTMERETALWLARSRLVEATAYPELAPPEDSRPDRFEGVDYVTRIEYRDVAPLPGIALDRVPREQRLIEIRVSVTWGNDRQVRLTGYRPRAADGGRPGVPSR